MSSRERASACVLAVSIAVLVWIGAFGCMSSPSFAFNHPDLKRIRGAYEGMSLSECRLIVPLTPAGHKDMDGMRIDAFVHVYEYQESSNTPSVQRKRFYFFHENRLVLWSDRIDWDGAASESIRWRELDKANAAEAQRRLEEAEADRAARNPPMGDSW